MKTKKTLASQNFIQFVLIFANSFETNSKLEHSNIQINRNIELLDT